MLKKLAAGTDFFTDLGGAVRVVAALVLAPFALLFGVMALLTPVVTVMILLTEGDWRLVAEVLGSGLITTLFGIPLCWITFRLFRGRKAANGITVLPTWLVRTFLLVFLGPLSVGMAVSAVIQFFRMGGVGDLPLTLLMAAVACGFVVSVVRAFHVAFRLGKRGNGDGAEPGTTRERPRD
jgi:hypothetical protein